MPRGRKKAAAPEGRKSITRMKVRFTFKDGEPHIFPFVDSLIAGGRFTRMIVSEPDLDHTYMHEINMENVTGYTISLYEEDITND